MTSSRIYTNKGISGIDVHDRTIHFDVPKVKNDWQGIDIATRRKFIAEEMFIIYPGFLRIAQEIKRRMHRCIDENKGSGLYCSIPSGAGKTHLIKFLRARWPENHEGTTSKIPVAAFSIPETPTARAMSRAFIYSTGSPGWKTGTGLDLFDRSIRIIDSASTTAICIDNMQDVPIKRREGGILTVGNWIRDLIDESRRLVVLFGTPAASAVLDANSQLRRRIAARLRLDYFAIEPLASGSQFRRFLHELDKRLPIAKLSGLDEPSMMKRIFWATNGIQDYIFQLTSEAVASAVYDGREKLSMDDFASAFESHFQDAGAGLNPFAANGPSRPLDHKGEPFFQWFDRANPSPQSLSTERTKRAK